MKKYISGSFKHKINFYIQSDLIVRCKGVSALPLNYKVRVWGQLSRSNFLCGEKVTDMEKNIENNVKTIITKYLI